LTSSPIAADPNSPSGNIGRARLASRPTNVAPAATLSMKPPKTAGFAEAVGARLDRGARQRGQADDRRELSREVDATVTRA